MQKVYEPLLLTDIRGDACENKSINIWVNNKVGLYLPCKHLKLFL